MPFQPGAMLNTQSFANRPENIEVPHYDVRAPSSQDINYPIGKTWLDQLNLVEYILLALTTSNGITSANWQVTTGSSGVITQITTDDAAVVKPVAGNVNWAGTGSTTTTGSGSTATLALTGLTNHNVLVGAGTATITKVAPSATAGVPLVSAGAAADPAFGTAVVAGGGTGAVTLTNHGVLLGQGTSPIVATAVGATGTLLAGNTGADPSFTGSPSVSGSLTAATTITATLGAITATNGNLVLGTAGNKVLSTSVGTTTAAGANSYGSVTLVGGTATVATTAVTASSLIYLSRMSVGATGAAALGILSVGTITAGTSFVINAWLTANATSLATTDVSNIAYQIVN
jgi:hypothetical protein